MGMNRRSEPAHRSLEASLRPLLRTDTEAIALAITDPTLRRWLRPPPDYPENLYARVQQRRTHGLGDVRVITVTDHLAGLVSVALRMTEQLSEDLQGAISPYSSPLGERGAGTCAPQLYGEIGYWVTKQFRRRGLARAAVGSFTQETLANPLVDWLQARIPVGNGPSRAVATACGYHEVGIFSADWRFRGHPGPFWLMRRERLSAAFED
jgi:RimJ/RimL family protein N-acetyltransferase